jgi:cytoskeletal protein CcmA (bactofilin family)
MARRTHDDAFGVAGADTVIGTGVEVHGNLSSESDIIVDGVLEGSIKAGGNVTLGVNAVVKGNIEATNITVSGQLHGNVVTTDDLTIRETGQLKGDIKVGGLTVMSGAIFIGRSVMQAAPQLDHSTKPTSDDGQAAPDHKES